MTRQTTVRRSYGLRLLGVDRLLGPGHADELPASPPTRRGRGGPSSRLDGTEGGPPVVRLRLAAGPPPPATTVDNRAGVWRYLDGRHVAIDRWPATATFFGTPPAPDLLVHPYLAPVATAFNRWAGREAFHAGAVVLADRAWVVLGPRTAGKSSLLAALTARGWPVFSDDVVIVDVPSAAGPVAYAGPRCLDLRQPLPGVPLPARPAREGTRLRVTLPSVPDRLPLAGWLFLRWGDRLTLGAVGPGDLLTRLAAGRTWPHLPSDPATLLTLAALPGFDLTRPLDWAALDDTCGLLGSVLSTSLAAPPAAGGVPSRVGPAPARTGAGA